MIEFCFQSKPRRKKIGRKNMSFLGTSLSNPLQLVRLIFYQETPALLPALNIEDKFGHLEFRTAHIDEC